MPRTERFRVAPRQDVASVYSVELHADPSELTDGNNKYAVLVRPPGRARRLLLVEGAPGYEHSFVKRAWLRDRGLEVDSVVRKGTNDRGEETYYVQAIEGPRQRARRRLSVGARRALQLRPDHPRQRRRRTPHARSAGAHRPTSSPSAAAAC